MRFLQLRQSHGKPKISFDDPVSEQKLILSFIGNSDGVGSQDYRVAGRIQFDKPIASYQLVQQKLVKMVTEITKAQLLCIQLGRLKEAGAAKYPKVSMAKMNNTAMALDVARNARDILGAMGISLRYSVMRHMCNLESVITYEGTDDMHRLIVGREITGIDAIR